MDNSIVISSHGINTINALPIEERNAIAQALASEMILGTDSCNSLSPIQEMLYSVIRFYVKRDSIRYKQAEKDVILCDL